MNTPLSLLSLLVLFVSVAPLSAGVEKNGDGTYTISGKWTFWPEKELLAPSGRENDFGEFKTLLFKSAVNDFSGVRQLKQSAATFVVKGRESVNPDNGDKVLVVEAIVSRQQ